MMAKSAQNYQLWEDRVTKNSLLSEVSDIQLELSSKNAMAMTIAKSILSLPFSQSTIIVEYLQKKSIKGELLKQFYMNQCHRDLDIMYKICSNDKKPIQSF
jgi:hypothetical protein